VTADLTRQALREADSMAFGPTGDSAMWSKQTKRLATLGAAYAAESAMRLSQERNDSADVQRTNLSEIGAAQARFKAQARDIAHNGYGDFEYWSTRAKRLAFESAAVAATTAALSDGPMLASVRDSLHTAMHSASALAFDGFGDMSYWSARTKAIEQAVAPLVDLPKPSSSGVGSGSPTVQATVQPYLDQVRDLAFDGYGDLDYWSKNAKHVAVDTGGFAARIAMLDAERLPPSDPDGALARVEEHATGYARAAQEAASGSGDFGFWSRRTKKLAMTTATYVAAVAGECDRDMIAALRPSLERLLARSEDLAFNGFGDATYWKGRCQQLGDEASLELRMLGVDLMAHRAAQASVASLPPGRHDARPLELEVARNRAVSLELDKHGQPLRADVERLDKKVSEVNEALRPLVEARSSAIKTQILDVWLVGGGGALALAGTVAAGAIPVLGLPLALVGIGAMGLALYRRKKSCDRINKANAASKRLEQTLQEAASERKQSADRLALLERRIHAADQAAAEAQKKLDVVRMANVQAAPDRVEVGNQEVRIGAVTVPRKG
jgi:hypothetical protein